MNMDKIANMLFPVIVSAIAWLLTSMASIQADLISIKSKMPILITEQGVIIDSPQSAEARAKLKDQLKSEIADLHIRVTLLEQHEKVKGNK
jgi:hypothetical protein